MTASDRLSAQIADIDGAHLERQLQSQGFAWLDVRLDADACAVIIGFIDARSPGHCEVNYGGTEKRIWNAEKLDENVAAFGRFADLLVTSLRHRSSQARSILALSNRPVPGEEALLTGRWHLDSLREQLKVFAFLTTVTDRSGPLEILSGSHRPLFKFGQFARGKLLTLADFITRRRRYQKLDDNHIDRLVAAGRKAVPMVCEAGSILVVNTSAIHRARPCHEAGRYALTAYYDHK